MRRQVELENSIAAELAGSEDAVLRTLEGHLQCRVFLRGNVLTLDGEPEAVDAAAVVVRELAELIAQGHEIAPGTIEAVTRALDQHESPAEILEDVVWRHRSTKVAPKTVNQKRYVDSIRKNTITFGIGPAGTGKTFLAVALAAAALSRREVNRIILTRPAVEAGERLGFLPGDLMAKVDPYLRPLFDALHDMLEAERVSTHLERGVIEVAPLAFMRGRSQPLHSQVLTPDGFVAIGSLRVGDLVVGSDGWPTPVLGVYPQGVKEIVRVTAVDGGSALCCTEHLWKVRAASGGWRVVEAGEVARLIRSGERVELPVLGAGNPQFAHQLSAPTGTLRSSGAMAPETQHVAMVGDGPCAIPGFPARRFVQSIEPAGRAETVCIQVAAADSLYVTDDYLVTHNTLNDSFIILDEAQNTSPEQMKMFLTRLGFNSRIVVTGDITQIDLPREQDSGLVVVSEILDGVEGIEFVRFGDDDVVRHKMVRRIVAAYNEHSQRAAPDLRPRRRA